MDNGQVKRILAANTKVERIDKILDFLEELGSDMDDILGGEWLIPVDHSTVENLPNYVEGCSEWEIIPNGFFTYVISAFEFKRAEIIQKNGMRKVR